MMPEADTKVVEAVTKVTGREVGGTPSATAGTTESADTGTADQRRFVQGSSIALVTCHAMSGFSRNRRMLYSYHRSPYGT